MNEKGVRPSKLGAPVVDKRGRVIGVVTSCAPDTEGFLTGMALIVACGLYAAHREALRARKLSDSARTTAP